jgi:predicted ATPase
MKQMRQGLAAFQATDAKQWLPFFFCELAWAYGRVGRPDEGLTLLAEAQAMMENTGERLYEVELYRLKGTLTLQTKTGHRQVTNKSTPSQDKSQATPEAEAEACFWKAIEIAQRQSAKSLELRAVLSLSRLWQQRGKREEARQMLAELYGWFSEGFDTADLQEAKALLAELT